MKTRQVIIALSIFIAGVAAGHFATYNCKSCCNRPAVQDTVSFANIGVAEANKLFHNYYDSVVAIHHKDTGIFKGFCLDKGKLNLFREIDNNAGGSAVKGYRIYPGGDKTGSTKIIVGIDSKGKDLTNYILTTKLGYSDPCPTICDSQSPIIAN